MSSSASGTSASLSKKGSVPYDGHVTNSDGSTTVIAMQVHIAGSHGTEAATIRIASATCARAPATPTHTPTSTKTHTVKPTHTSTHQPTTKPTATPTATTSIATTSTTRQPQHNSTTSPAPTPTAATTHVPVTG